MSRFYRNFLSGTPPGRVYDTDAINYLVAAGIPNNSTQYFTGTQYAIQGKQYWVAVNNLFVNLKDSGLYNEMYAFWPMIGGTSSSCKWNAKDPRDLDAAYRLTFNGGIIFSSTGITPNGINAYANTYIVPNVVFNETDYQSFGYFSRTDSAIASEYVMGSNSGSTNGACALIIRRNNNLRSAVSDFSTSSFRAAQDFNSLNGIGFFIGNQRGTSMNLYVNGAIVASDTVGGSNALGSRQVVLFAILNSIGITGGHTNKECSFCFVAKKLTNTQVSILNTIVYNFNNSLGR
jgi:hypothetical protein